MRSIGRDDGEGVGRVDRWAIVVVVARDGTRRPKKKYLSLSA